MKKTINKPDNPEGLTESIENYRSLYDYSLDAILLTGPDGSIYSANPAACKMFGRTEKEICRLGRSGIVDITNPSLSEALKQRETEGSYFGELIMIRKNGEKFPVEISTNIFTTPDGLLRTSMIIRDISERKRAEEALKNLLSFTGSILESIHNGILVISMQRTVIRTNARFAEMWRIPVEILNSSDDKILLAYVVGQLTDPDAFTKKVEELYENPEAGSFDLIYFRDGRIFERISRPMYIGSEPRGRVWSFLDITERKQAEQTLLLEKENFRNSIDDSPLGVRIATIEGDTIYANRTLLDFYTYNTLEELQKTPLKDRYTPDSYAEAQKRKYQRMLGDFNATEYEISIIRKNGEIRHLRVFRKDVLWDGARQFQIIYEDITERMRVEEALRESEARYRSLFENSLMGISVADTDGHLVQANLAYAQMYGYKNLEEMLSEITNVGMLYANPVERKEVIRILRSKGFMEAREVEVVRRDGSRFFVLVSASEIRDSEGKLLYNQAIHIDVSDRRRNEGEIKKSKELLEKLNQHLNEIREEERALISRKIHDELGQSMTALKLDLNRMHKYLNTNPEAVAKLKSMIELVSDTIKDVQRISSDLRPGILDELGLVSAIEWYCDEFEERTGIKCNLKLDDSDYIDSQISLTFFRVLQETLTNVIRHANASSVNIKLQKQNKGMTMTIKDDGIGIPEEKLRSIKSLGLISMRERIKQNNGTIDISSKKDNGTKLVIFIPS